ncbi:hypothetical protein CBR_g40157 [Chara braunii]|uniref:Fibronectin type-III domain-containing protein n=1 Tax=Chara braunii TaxID=69332 RepID=A0A388LT61_CHABU|nr:hypothetical protein CBR_g40157 [Chara braunii]|eukprot:GBG85518.1 hypothetical protein CBR_g40157 [Chara braunii]
MAGVAWKATCLFVVLLLSTAGALVGAGESDPNHQSEARHHLESFFCTVDSDGDGEIEHHEASQFLRRVSGDHADVRPSGWGLSSDDLGGIEEKVQTVEAGGFQDVSSNFEFNYGGSAISHDEFKTYLRDMLTAQHVADWVAHGLGLPQYANAFRDKSIDGLMFPFLWKDPKVLQEELGVTSSLHAKRITVGIMIKMLGIGEAPGQPAKLRSEPGRCGGIVLKWNRPEKAGTPRVHKYVVEKLNAQKLAWEILGELADQESEMAFLDENVQSGTTYKYRVTAWGAYGPNYTTEYLVAPEHMEGPPRPVPDGLIGSPVSKLVEVLKGVGCLVSFGLLMVLLVPWASRHLWTSMGSALPTAVMSLFATPHSQVEPQDTGDGCRRRTDNMDADAINTSAREAKVPALTAVDAPLALLNRPQIWASDREAGGNDPAVQRSTSMDSLNHLHESQGDVCGSEQLPGIGHVDLADGGSVSHATAVAEAGRAPRKALKKSCNADQCNVRFDWSYWKSKHYCKRCQGVFCQEHTKYADHNRWTSCKLETQCLCNSCFRREPSPVRARLASENKLLKGEVRSPSTASRKNRKERPDVPGRKISGRDPLTPCSLSNHMSLKRVNSTGSAGYYSDEQENVSRMGNMAVSSGNYSVKSVLRRSSSAMQFTVVRAPPSSPVGVPCQQVVDGLADIEQGDQLPLRATDEQSGAGRSRSRELSASVRGNGTLSDWWKGTGNQAKCTESSRECMNEPAKDHKPLRFVEANGAPGKVGQQTSSLNDSSIPTGRTRTSCHAPSSSAHRPLLLLPAPASTSNTLPTTATVLGGRGLIGGTPRAHCIRDLANTIKFVEEAGPEMQDGSHSSANGGPLSNAAASGNSGIVGMSLEGTNGIGAPKKGDEVRDPPLRKGGDIQQAAAGLRSPEGCIVSCDKMPTRSKWQVVKQLVFSSAIRQQRGLDSQPDCCNSTPACEGGAQISSAESSEEGPPAGGNRQIDFVKEHGNSNNVNVEERPHAVVPSPAGRESVIIAVSSLSSLTSCSSSSSISSSESSADPMTTTEKDDSKTPHSSCCSEHEGHCGSGSDESPSVWAAAMSKQKTSLQVNGHEPPEKCERDEKKEKGDKSEACSASHPLKRKLGLYRRSLSGRLELMLQGGNHSLDNKGGSGNAHSASSSSEVHSKSEGGLNFLTAAKKARRRWRLAGICVIFSRRSRPRSPSTPDSYKKLSWADSESQAPPTVSMSRTPSFGERLGRVGDSLQTNAMTRLARQ